MKTLIAALVLLSSSAYACAVADMNIYEIREESHFVEVSAGSAVFPGYLFSQFESLGDFEIDRCKDAIKEVVVQDTDGSRLRLLYTIEDSCDGGNSYGVILDDKTLAPVALIHDSDVSCI